MKTMIKICTVDLEESGEGSKQITYTISCDDKGEKNKKKVKMKSKKGGKEVVTICEENEIRIEVDDNGEIKTFTIDGKDVSKDELDTEIQVTEDKDGKKIIIIKAGAKEEGKDK